MSDFDALPMWEILVPTVRNPPDSRPYRLRYHKVWDNKVREICGGLTVMRPAKGTWTCPDSGNVFEETMIPVRIRCTEAQMLEIAKMTKKYYEQLAVIVTLVSDKCIIV